MNYFAQPTLGRDQFVLIPTTLEDTIPDDHEVRLLDEILQTQDCSSWEAEYSLRRGQPPIPPRVVASVILYGLLRRVRSSRVLEYMTGHNVDFLWLTEGRTIAVRLAEACAGIATVLLRGREKVRMEWLWACTGYNLRKLISEVARLRVVRSVVR